MATPSLTPGFGYRLWWSATEPARLIIRLVVELFLRKSKWMLLPQAVRLVAHLAVGSPVTTLLVAAWLFGPLPFGAVLAAVAPVEGWLLYRRWRGTGGRLLAWRLAWKFHRVWPRVWADAAARTQRVQAHTGGEKTAAARQRPVVDHPRMSWRFWIRWPVVTFRVGTAPGRTFVEFERVMAAFAANLTWVQAVELEYGSDRSSFGLIHVSFTDVLAEVVRPDWARDTDEDGEAA